MKARGGDCYVSAQTRGRARSVCSEVLLSGLLSPRELIGCALLRGATACSSGSHSLSNTTTPDGTRPPGVGVYACSRFVGPGPAQVYHDGVSGTPLGARGAPSRLCLARPVPTLNRGLEASFAVTPVSGSASVHLGAVQPRSLLRHLGTAHLLALISAGPSPTPVLVGSVRLCREGPAPACDPAPTRRFAASALFLGTRHPVGGRHDRPAGVTTAEGMSRGSRGRSA